MRTSSVRCTTRGSVTGTATVELSGDGSRPHPVVRALARAAVEHAAREAGMRA
ncbi:hypothetical protein [Streptomyces chartreusis]|uniref:hypothetical protein n=1 Tax=Streptomyces chartreusis TaxID=1969 RepID=UPI003442C5A0